MENGQRHSEEFQREAVKLVTEDTERTPKTSESVEAELLRLREENRRLRMERDILKQARAFFANDKS
jgi:transposase